MSAWIRKFGAGACAAALALWLPAVAADLPETGDGLDALVSDVQDAAAQFYGELLSAVNYPVFADPDALLTAVRAARAAGRPVQAVALILANEELAAAGVHERAFLDLLAVLVETNAMHAARRLRDVAERNGDRAVVAHIRYLFATEHFAREDWAEVLRLLDGTAADLPQSSYYHAWFMTGVARQHLQDHRGALAAYTRIGAGSAYHRRARVNMAVANLRQGWWTDTHAIIEELLRTPQRIDPHEADRLRVMLGYALMRNELFRNARTVLRDVARDGPHTHRALLGIAIAAGYQNDYPGALNAAMRLRDDAAARGDVDLYVEESYLLVPYFLERLGDGAAAFAGYTEAMRYYDERIARLERRARQRADVYPDLPHVLAQRALRIDGEALDLDALLPPAYFRAWETLNAHRRYIEQHRLRAADRHAALERRMLDALGNAIERDAERRIGYLRSYMNQARFGLARLHDAGVFHVP